MDFRKVAVIALKDLRVLFSDRNLLLIMFVAPIALTAIIASALGGFAAGGSGGDSPISNIAVAVVNEDKGNAFVNYGNVITSILIPAKPDPANALQKLIKATRLDSREAAMQAVKQGKYAAAVFIPANLSASLDPLKTKPDPVDITLYRDTGSPISASVVSSVVRGIITNITSGTVAIYAMQGNMNPLQIAALAGQVSAAVGKELSDNPPLVLAQQTVSGQAANPAQGFNALQYFAPAMAIFFVLFTTSSAASSILEEQTNGTLQRLAISPTSRATILAGKLGGTYLSGLAQLSILIIAMAALGTLFGTKNGVWGTNIPAIILTTIVTTLAACGIGVFIGGLARTATQADTLSSVIVTFSGMLGGAFFPIANLGGAFALVSRLTPNYWATNAYSELARTNDLGTILPNLAVLLVIFVVFFSIGTALFNRRLRA